MATAGFFRDLSLAAQEAIRSFKDRIKAEQKFIGSSVKTKPSAVKVSSAKRMLLGNTGNIFPKSKMLKVASLDKASIVFNKRFKGSTEAN